MNWNPEVLPFRQSGSAYRQLLTSTDCVLKGRSFKNGELISNTCELRTVMSALKCVQKVNQSRKECDLEKYERRENRGGGAH